MEAVIEPIDRNLILKELTPSKFIRVTRKGHNFIFEVTAQDSPYTMQEIGRLREISFRLGGGGTGKSVDIDAFDTDPMSSYKQLIVWDPKDQEIIGGYRYINCKGLDIAKMATRELFNFSDKFLNEYLPYTIELGRSFIQPNYQSANLKRKSLYALDNLWDGLGALIVKNANIRYFFGKVTMYTSYNQQARDTLLYFMHNFFPDRDSLVTPIDPLRCNLQNPAFAAMFSNLGYKEGYRILQKELKSLGEHVPPLINSYMNLSTSMKMFGTAVNREFGEVEESGILVTIKDIYPEKIDRYITPLITWAQKMRIKWWRSKK